MGPHPCEETEDVFARPSARAFSDARPFQHNDLLAPVARPLEPSTLSRALDAAGQAAETRHADHRASMKTRIRRAAARAARRRPGGGFGGGSEAHRLRRADV